MTKTTEETNPLLGALITVFVVPIVALWMAVIAALLLVFWPVIPVLVYLHLLQKRKAE